MARYSWPGRTGALARQGEAGTSHLQLPVGHVRLDPVRTLCLIRAAAVPARERLRPGRVTWARHRGKTSRAPVPQVRRREAVHRGLLPSRDDVTDAKRAG